MTSLSPSLASLRNELESTTSALHALADSLDDTGWRARPADGRWSVAECVEHLNITSRAYVPLLKEALRDARGRAHVSPNGSHRLDLMGWMLIKFTEPPVKPRRRMRTPAPFVPSSVGTKAGVIAEYEKLQRELIALLVESEGLAVAKIKVHSAFNAKMRYSVYSAFRVIAAHQRRHLWQAQRAIEEVRATAR